MKQKYIYIVIITLSLALLGIIYFLKEKEIDSRLTFNKKDKIPYGCYVAYNLLEQHFGKKNTVITKTKPAENEEVYQKDSSCLFIVNSFFNPTDNDIDWLSYYAQNGNTIVISTAGLNHIAKKFFACTPAPMFIENNFNFQFSFAEKFTPLQLQVTTLPNATTYKYPGIGYETHFLQYDSTIATPIGKNSVAENALQFNIGKGKVIIHLAPVAFTNLFLLHQKNIQYFENLLAYINPLTKSIIWDEYFMGRRLLLEKTNEKGILSVLFSYSNFRWALYILLFAALVLIATEIKRKQKMIPIYNSPTNESLQFIETIGLLYFNKGNHKNIAEKMIAHFLDIVRNKYHIPTQQINSILAQKLVQKSNIDIESATALIDTIQQIQLQHNISEIELQQLYNALQKFYKNA